MNAATETAEAIAQAAHTVAQVGVASGVPHQCLLNAVNNLIDASVDAVFVDLATHGDNFHANCGTQEQFADTIRLLLKCRGFNPWNQEQS